MEERSIETHALVCGDRLKITAVVATYNEEAHIGRCLSDLLNQREFGGDLEIVVVDGMSRDRTVDIVRSFPEFGTKIRLIFNRRRLQVYAWNLALREMTGEYFSMITAHAEYAPDYFARCLETMRATGATAVGGVPRACAQGALGQAVAWCMSSPFGVGGARFRYLKKAQECDTVPLIFVKRTSVEAIGGWDERIAFDEDSDLSYRLRAAGAKLYVSPKIGVRYYTRETFRALWKQMFRYGYWRRFTQLKHPHGVPLRVLAPPMLLLALLASAALAGTNARLLGAIVPGAYGAFLALAALASIPRTGLMALLVPPSLAVMHVAYGLGYWKAFATMRPIQQAAEVAKIS